MNLSSSGLLEVERSLQGARWRLEQPDPDPVAVMAQRYDIPELLARLLVGRGITLEAAPRFIEPTFQKDFPDPHSLAGMKACAADIAAAIEAGQSFAIFGDFDVDGATSSAVVYRFLKACCIEAPIYIPERLTEGYGPNEEALKALKDDGANILLMLDCGTGAVDTIAYGQEIGLQIVILDHHETGDVLPPAWHLINPKRKDDESGLDMMAAVGVSFMFCVAVNAALRKTDFYNKNNIQEPDLKAMIDLVALGTVCDIVPLTHVNRLLVRRGFERMNAMQNTGLAALCQTSGIEPPFNPYHAGYVLGPRVNAGSRVGQSSLGAQLFTLEDQQKALDIAWILEDCNDKRKSMQVQMEDEALHLVEAQSADDAPVVIVASEGWHSGLTGLVAGRLKEKLKKPACVICIEGDILKASGRSVPGVHIGQAFIDAMGEGLMQKGGGHAMAGGFSAKSDQLDQIRRFLVSHVETQLAGQSIVAEQYIDLVTSVRGAANVKAVKMLEEKGGPFGAEFESPLFALPSVKLHQADIVGNAHVRLLFADQEGGQRMKGIAFRAVDTPMGTALLKGQGGLFHLAGRLKINSWQGNESVELHVVDAALAG